MDKIEKLGGLGASDIGALFTGQGLKAKTAQTLAYKKALELITGEKETFTTPAMMHGIFSEEEAFNLVVKPAFPDAIYQSADSIHIAPGMWATPDVVDWEQKITMDIKCPYTVFTFFKNWNNLPAVYIAQNQMQLLATGHKKGFIVLYLTSNVIDEFGNIIQYDIPIEQRHVFLPLDADQNFQDEILFRSTGFFKLRDQIAFDLSGANTISDMEYFQAAKKASRVTRFKDKSNLTTWGGKIFFNEREGYIIIED